MTYQIRINYRTGDSFKSHDEEGVLEVEWNDLRVAKANIQRIKEHYEYYCFLHSTDYEYSKYAKEEKIQEMEKFLEEVENKDWRVKKSRYGSEENLIILKTDDGKDWQFRVFWCGYFESLQKATIETMEDDGMSYEPK